MANTQSLGFLWKPKAWGDGEPVPRITLPDGTFAEAAAALEYGYDPSTATWIRRKQPALLMAVINVAASGDNTLVSADATRKIKVVSYVYVATAAVTVTWKSGVSTSLSGGMAIAASGGVSAQGTADQHLIETAVNQALILNLGGAVQVSGHLSYYLE